MKTTEKRKDLVLGIVTNSYNIPLQALARKSFDAVKGTCPFVDGCVGAKCINEFCHDGTKPRAVSSDDCLLLDENEEVGRRRALEILYQQGLTLEGAYVRLCSDN